MRVFTLVLVDSAATFTWVRPGTTGVPPSSRHGHSAVYDESSARMVVFGGWHPGDDGVPEYQRDTRQLDLHTLTWSRPRMSGESPGARYAHTVACVGNVMVVSGGYDGPRDAASIQAGYPTEKILVPYTPGMGGDALAGPGSTIEVLYGIHPDTFFLDLETLDWIQPGIAGKPPSYRYGSSATPTGAQVLMFGGWEGGRPMNDLIILDLTGLVDSGQAAASGEYGAPGEETDATGGAGLLMVAE